MTDEDLIRAERVSVRAAARRPGDPLAIRCLHEVTEHTLKRRSARHPGDL